MWRWKAFCLQYEITKTSPWLWFHYFPPEVSQWPKSSKNKILPFKQKLTFHFLPFTLHSQPHWKSQASSRNSNSLYNLALILWDAGRNGRNDVFLLWERKLSWEMKKELDLSDVWRIWYKLSENWNPKTRLERGNHETIKIIAWKEREAKMGQPWKKLTCQKGWGEEGILFPWNYPPRAT